jgi:hypothetical protein
MQFVWLAEFIQRRRLGSCASLETKPSSSKIASTGE